MPEGYALAITVAPDRKLEPSMIMFAFTPAATLVGVIEVMTGAVTVVYVNVLFGPWMPERVHLAYTYVVPVGNPILSRRMFPFRGVRGIHAPSFTLYTQEVGAVFG